MGTIWEHTSLRGLVLLVTWGGDDSEVLSHEPSRRFRTYLCRIFGKDTPADSRKLGKSASALAPASRSEIGFVDVTASTQSMIVIPAVLVLQSAQTMTAIGPRKRAKWAFAFDASASKDHHFCILDSVLHYGFHDGMNNALNNHIDQYNRCAYVAMYVFRGPYSICLTKTTQLFGIRAIQQARCMLEPLAELMAELTAC